MPTVQQFKARRAAAKKERDQFQPLMDEAYQYAIPFRKSSKESGTGEKRVNQVFDHTAIDSAVRFAGKYQQDIWPVGQENFALEPGSVVFDPRERELLTKQLKPIESVLQAFFTDGWFDIALHEMALDLSAGNGCMLMNSTADMSRLWEPISVAIDEVIWEQGANNRVSGIFWDRRMTLRVMMETWPEGKYGVELTKLFKDRPETDMLVHIDTVWVPPKGNAKAGRWVMSVWCDKQDEIVFESKSRTAPFLTPRYLRVPGETYGRGVVMMAMPTIKTLNTAKRLQLQAAAIAMLGIYTAIDDGVFNPDLSPVAPGQFWKVQRNGGSLGPSVSRFPDPRLDLSDLIIKDMQGAVRQTMMDNDLPNPGEAVKTPTEILERVRRAASDHIGAFGRQVVEVVVPAVQRAIELAYDKGLIRSHVSIDQLLIRVRVKSPVAIAREAARIEKILNWLQMVLTVCEATGTSPERIAEIDAVLIQMGRDLGVPENFIVAPEKREKMDEAAAKQAQVLQAAQLAALATTGKMPA